MHFLYIERPQDLNLVIFPMIEAGQIYPNLCQFGLLRNNKTLLILCCFFVVDQSLVLFSSCDNCKEVFR